MNLKDLFNLLCEKGASASFIQEPKEDGSGEYENVAVILVGGLEIVVKNAKDSLTTEALEEMLKEV